MTEDNLDGLLNETKNILDEKFKKMEEAESTDLIIRSLTGTQMRQDRAIYLSNKLGLRLALCSDFYSYTKNKGSTNIQLCPEEFIPPFDLYSTDGEKPYLSNEEMNKKLNINSRIITGDVIEFYKNNTNTRIWRNYGSNILDSNIIRRPGYDRIDVMRPFINTENYPNIMKTLDTEIGLRFLQALFRTEDKPSIIYDTLKKMFEPQINDVHFSIPTENSIDKICRDQKHRTYKSTVRFVGQVNMMGTPILKICLEDIGSMGNAYGITAPNSEMKNITGKIELIDRHKNQND